MKNTKKLLSFILSGVMLTSSVAFTANAQSQEEKQVAKYGIDFVYDTGDADSEFGTATATVSIIGGNFGVGRFGFSYDPEILILVDKDGNKFDAEKMYVADAIIGAEVEDSYTVVTTEETNLTSNLIDTEKGNILFAWYVDSRIVDGKDVGYIPATSKAMPVATINFIFGKEGRTEEEIDEIFGGSGVITNPPNEGLPNGWGENPIVSKGEDEDIETDVKIEFSKDNVSVDVLPVENLDAKADGTNITVSWRYDNEAESTIDYYIVEITENSDGTVITHVSRKFEVGDEAFTGVSSNKSKYSYKFTETDDSDKFEYNKTYKVVVTPVSKLGNTPENVESKNVTIKKPTVNSGSTSSASGASLTYTVTYLPGEGTIPEGQKFKYEVARNGYVSGSPAVIAPEGKIFAGWSVDGVTLISVEVYKITKDTSFKAIYVEKESDTHRPFILGYPGGEVRADNSLTRAEAAAIIARSSANFDSTKKYTANFTDVPEDHWAANYIAFVYESNIVTGYEDNTYHPSSNITRAEFATIMQRYLGLELNEDASFIDVGKDHWAVAYIGACKYAGLINGYENGEFRPSNEITRAEAVKILNRATDRSPNPTAINAYVGEKGIPFEDLDSNKWYFYEIMEAAFPHLISYYH